MIAASAKEIKSITILVKEKDLASVKAILNFLKEKFSRFSIMKFRTGKIGEDILVSFKVSSEFYPKVLEKFAYNDIPLIMKDKDSLDFIDEKKEQKRKKLRAQGWSEITVHKSHISLTQLQKLANEGKVKEVAKEAKGDVSSKIEIVNKAKSLLTHTIDIAIENLGKYAEDGIGKSQEAIEQLILIATDKDLKLFHKHEEIKKAGFTAIEISLSHKNYNDNLISIANNSKLNHLINIKAAISLADLIFPEPDQYIKIVSELEKSLNTRWLKIALESSKQKLSSIEIDSFNELIEFVESKRKQAQLTASENIL